ncbi:MAG: transposase [Candidatus Aminicenantes bacterium]|nr:MAG: transposase [Candidatus Aminicenantes bacterium]
MNEKIKEELILLLIYLTGWEEDKKNAPGEKVYRAWKGYRFEILNELQNQRLIYQIPGGKSLILTDEGKQKAEQLRQKYL